MRAFAVRPRVSASRCALRRKPWSSKRAQSSSAWRCCGKRRSSRGRPPIRRPSSSSNRVSPDGGAARLVRSPHRATSLASYSERSRRKRGIYSVMKLRTVHLRAHLASRPWTERERFIVWRGMTGRFSIAIEPLLGMLFFGFLAWGVIWRARVSKPHDLWILSPLFGLMALGFAAYFIAVMFAPLTAYLQTFKPIYILD